MSNAPGIRRSLNDDDRVGGEVLAVQQPFSGHRFVAWRCVEILWLIAISNRPGRPTDDAALVMDGNEKPPSVSGGQADALDTPVVY